MSKVELTLRAVRLKRIEEEFPIFRCAVAFMRVALTALLLGLLEPALAAPDANRLFLVCFLLAFLRSPVWLTSLLGDRKAGSA